MIVSLRTATLLLLLFFVLPLTGCERTAETTLHSSVREEKANPPVENPPGELISTQHAFMEVSRNVTPGVVNIRAARVRPQRGGEFGPLFEDFFGDLFRGDPRPRPQREHSLGSGFLISEDGYILTNNHVIRDAEEITVRLSDQRVYAAKVVGMDPRTDVAVLKIEANETLPFVVLGDSEHLQVGQWALAIGNPFGLDRTLTVGVISAIGRAGLGIEDYEDFIQTDASINPGNSGGPLLNIYGEVIGINTAIVATGQGIGFAIPINLARLIATQLIETGEVVRGWLGVSIQPLTPELAESFGLDRVTGALVNHILPGSPAANADLQRGDILLLFDGKEVRGVRELQLLVASAPVGKRVDVEVLRSGKRLKVPVVIAEMEQTSRVALTSGQPSRAEGLGFAVIPADGEGVLVDAVEPGSRAASAGVQPGDILLSINRQEIDSLEAFRKAAEQARGRNVVLLLKRGASTLYLAFPAP
jgi:Do/DeqQ family serine protease